MESDEAMSGSKTRALKPRDTTPPEAYERAPTLMAGQSAGSQGMVRVWAPSPRIIRVCIQYSAVVLVCGVAAWMTLHRGFGRVLFDACVGAVISPLYYGWKALRRPGYITTDDAGIAITTRRGSQYLPWNSVVSCEVVAEGTDRQKLILWTPERVECSLAGYSSGDRTELMQLIVAKAGMVPHHLYLNRYIHRSMLPTPKIENGEFTLVYAAGGEVVVESVQVDSAAARAGLETGDEIVMLNGLPVDILTQERLNAEVTGRVGGHLTLVVRREQRQYLLDFTIEAKTPAH